MAKQIHRLSAVKVKTITTEGYTPDGNGLYLQVSKTLSKSWIFRFTLAGKTREMGIGSLNTFTLAEARDIARTHRQQVANGIDPIDARNLSQRAKTKAATFDEVAAAFIEGNKAGWRNPKSAIQWGNSLKNYASPVFGKLPISSIDTALVLEVLTPIWTTKNETADRVRGRIERILDYAKTQKLRAGENPAAWKGHLSTILPKPSAVSTVKHRKALPYADMAQFESALRTRTGDGVLALRLIILTAVRTNEAIASKWEEFNLATGIWTIPANRMKANKEHCVPLSPQALTVLGQIKAVSESGYLFKGKNGKHASLAICSALLKRMERLDITVHGFRSTFSDWANNTTSHANPVIEMALSHAISNKAEAAYRRGDLFDKRQSLMNDWGAFVVAS